MLCLASQVLGGYARSDRCHQRNQHSVHEPLDPRREWTVWLLKMSGGHTGSANAPCDRHLIHKTDPDPSSSPYHRPGGDAGG